MPFMSDAYFQALSPDKQKELLKTHLLLGYQPETHDHLCVPDVDRYAGMYVCGVQGVGKSGLLENIIAHDAQAGNAEIVLDAHGDLIAHCLAQLPPDRLAKTYLLDMEDEQFPFGVNVFATGKLDTDLARTQAVERIMHIFEVLWTDVLSQQNLPRYVRAATITLLANPGSTLVDMYAMLTNESYRARLLANVTDTGVTQFWKTNFDDLSPSEQLRRVQPLINRLEALFMGRNLVRNIVGQRVTTVNFRKAIEDHEIIFIRLPVKTVAQDARLIGTMLMAQIHAAVFSFANVPELKRPGVSLYIDEFQNFSTSDIAELFSEGRKFGLKLTVAHQYRNQLPSYLQNSTMTARTKICFQLTPEDGREMAHVFPAQEETLKVEDIEPHPVNYLLTYGSDNPIIKTFIETYLRPLQGQKRGNRVEMDHFNYDWVKGERKENRRESDPTPYLDNLLYQVMRTGDANPLIPPDAVIGFSNCGKGFYGNVRGIAKDDWLLSPQVIFPRALVVKGATGDLRWTRKPESGIEQLYHFLFHLRMAMYALAENPIGKKSAPSHAAVGQMLTNLPRRAAFVKSAETVGVIYTEDTPNRLQGRELVKRIETILAQTSNKYSHPRAEVKRLFVQPSASASPAMPVARWEEL